MPKNLTDVDAFTDPVPSPQDNDGATATAGSGVAPVETTFQALANRTRYLLNLITALTSSVALAANQVLGRSSSGATGGKATSDFSFAQLARETAVAQLDAVHTQGANIAAASVTNLASATGFYVYVTGAGVTIQAFGVAAAGTFRSVRFAGINTLNHGGSLLLPGATDITTAANDELLARSEGGGVWRVIAYQRAALIPGAAADLVEGEGVALVSEYDAGMTKAAWRIALAKTAGAGSFSAGTVVKVTGTEEVDGRVIPIVSKAIGESADASALQDVAIVIEAVDVGVGEEAIGNGVEVFIRYIGLVEDAIETGEFDEPLVGDPIYINADSELSLTPENTVSRQVGNVASVTGEDYAWVVTVWFDGFAGNQGPIYPTNPDGTRQIAFGLYVSDGVPDDTKGTNGSFCFRGGDPDGELTRVYIKSSGAWQGIL